MRTYAIALGLALGSCGPRDAVATFRARPDSVEPARLAGPYTGKLVEAAGKAPLAGAVVVGAWHVQTPNGPGESIVRITASDPAGMYAFSAETPPRGAFFSEFVLTVYKRGYVGYRSDATFPARLPRRDFAQRDQWIEMERWSETYSHAEHVRYVGGGPLATVTAWESDLAAAELSMPRGNGIAGPVRRTVAAQLLSTATVKSTTAYDGEFETGPLGDEPDSAMYSSQHWRSIGRPEAYDVALRMWTLPGGEAEKRYSELLDQLPGVMERDEIGTRSFRAKDGPVMAIGLLDAGRGAVLLLTCGTSLCASDDNALALMRSAHERLILLLGGRL